MLKRPRSSSPTNIRAKIGKASANSSATLPAQAPASPRRPLQILLAIPNNLVGGGCRSCGRVGRGRCRCRYARRSCVVGLASAFVIVVIRREFNVTADPDRAAGRWAAADIVDAGDINFVPREIDQTAQR